MPRFHNPLGVPAFCIDPYSALHGLTISRDLSKAAGTDFDGGQWTGPCFVGKPESPSEQETVRELLRDAKLLFEEVD